MFPSEIRKLISTISIFVKFIEPDKNGKILRKISNLAITFVLCLQIKWKLTICICKVDTTNQTDLHNKYFTWNSIHALNFSTNSKLIIQLVTLKIDITCLSHTCCITQNKLRSGLK